VAGATVATGVAVADKGVAVTGTGVAAGVGAEAHAAMPKSSAIDMSMTSTEICLISIIFSYNLTESLAIKLQEYAIPLFDATLIAAHFTRSCHFSGKLLLYAKAVALNHCDNLLKSNFIGIVGDLNDQLVGLSIGHTRQVLKVR
jgi:hypothetical protein